MTHEFVDGGLDAHWTAMLAGATGMPRPPSSPAVRVNESLVFTSGQTYPISREPRTRQTAEVSLADQTSACRQNSVITPLLSPMCQGRLGCGSASNALLTKLSVNSFLITAVTWLVETFHFATEQGLAVDTVAVVLNAGPTANDVSRVKLGKSEKADSTAQAPENNGAPA